MFIAHYHELALELFEPACDGGIGEGCHFVEKFHDEGFGVARNTSAALYNFEQACALGAANSCFWLQTCVVMETPLGLILRNQ